MSNGREKTRYKWTPMVCFLAGGALSAATGQWWSTPRAVLRAEGSSSIEDRRVLNVTGDTFESVARIVSPAVVYIEAGHHDENGDVETEESGSGILVRPRSLGRAVVVTNLHVVAGAELQHVDVHLADGRRLHPVHVWSDEETDLALLDMGTETLPAARIGDSDKARIGQWVLAIGSPFGLAQSVTHGIVSAKHRRQVGLPRSLRIKEFLQTDAAINPGNSGGPLVNLDGEVIGINTAIASKSGSSSGVGFAVPMNLVSWVMDELIVHGMVRRAFLGVEFPTRFTFERARDLGLSSPRGALVATVHPNTPAQLAGLRVDDVIVEFDGTPIEDDHHLINTVSQTPIGKKVGVVIWRDGRRLAVEATLGNWRKFRERASADSSPSPTKAPTVVH